MKRKISETVAKISDAEINWSRYPPLKDYKTNRLKTYLILHVVKKELGIQQLSASEISSILFKKFRYRTTPQAIRAALKPKIGEDVEINERIDGVVVYSLLPVAINSLGIDADFIDMNFNPTDIVIPFEVFKKTKDYIKKVVIQINGCYRDGYYDACAAMTRRLFETLIVEIYEVKKIEYNIKDHDNKYLKLSGLIKKIINEPEIKLSSQTKNHLPKIKLFGDTAAHSRKIILRKTDIDKYKDEIRLSSENLVNELMEK